MKKQINLLVATLLLTVVGATAQAQVAAPSASANTNVHVVLQDVISLAVNQADVTLTFATTTDYQNGVTAPMANHLTATSNKPYTLRVNAATDLNAATSANGSLEAGVLSITVPTDGTNAGKVGTVTPVTALTTSDQTLFTDAAPAVNQNINVNYAVPASVSNSTKILGKNADTYTTVVTYTISQ
jgi:hypothetical protein